MAVGAATVAALVLAWQVGILFLLVTIGGRGVALASVLGEPAYSMGFAPSRVLTLRVTLLAVPFVVWQMRRLARVGGWRAGALLGGAAVAAALMALSDRFPALVLGAAFAWSVRRPALLAHPRRSTWVLLVGSLALACAPVDVSLRVRPNGPQFARGTIGLLRMPPVEFDATGDTVVVGGCSSLYNEPRWVWVW